MTVPPAAGFRRGRDAPGGRAPGWRAARRSRLLARQPTAALVLGAMAVVVGVGIALQPVWVPVGAMMFVVLLGVFVLRLRGMVVVSVVVVAVMTTVVATRDAGITQGQLIVLGLAVASGLAFVRSRDRLGLQGAASDLMLVDLRDRLVAHGRIPALPDQWAVDSVVRSAYAQAFSGDFVVASRSQRGQLLEIVLVDVSGKGQEAGVRSLLLSGAFGGLLGAMPRQSFLPAANDYLLQQAWAEGFATAVHLAVRLDTGRFWVSTAGHPPALHVRAGSGRVEIVDTAGGPALGIVEAPTFGVHEGLMEPGDTLVLYTDGVVERSGSDVDLGIDRLMGETERLVSTRTGGAGDLITGVRAGESDDRALILVHRK